MNRNIDRNRIWGAMLLGAVWSTAAVSAPTVGVTLRHIDLHPATPAAAMRSMRRIDEAALDVCGASGALVEAKRAIRAGQCWQEAAGNAARQSGDPLLAQAFARFPLASR
jgi:UrcA family protein